MYYIFLDSKLKKNFFSYFAPSVSTVAQWNECFEFSARETFYELKILHGSIYLPETLKYPLPPSSELDLDV